MARSKVFPSGTDYDDFNRAGTGSSPDLGTNYTDVRNSSSGRCIIEASTHVRGSAGFVSTGLPTYGCYVDADGGSFSDDQYAEISTTLNGTGGALAVGVWCRLSGDASNYTGYYASIYYTGSQYRARLGKVVSNTNTYLDGGSYVIVTWADGDRLGLEVEGTTLRVTRNGSEIGGNLTTTDSSISTGRPGLFAEGSATTNRLFADNFQAGDITAGGGGSSVGAAAHYFSQQ